MKPYTGMQVIYLFVFNGISTKHIICIKNTYIAEGKKKSRKLHKKM